MKNIHIVLIVDKSGSMQPLTKDTIGGFNAYLDGLEGDPKVSAMLFDTSFKVLFKDQHPKHAPRLDNKSYQPSGGTALYDAVGKTLEELEFPKDSDVLCVIQTDGEENSSKEFTADKVKAALSAAKENGWDFLYLGADDNAWKGAGAMGIAAASTFSTNMSSGSDIKTMYAGMTVASNGYTIEKRRFSDYGGVDNAAKMSQTAYAAATAPITTTHEQAKKKVWND